MRTFASRFPLIIATLTYLGTSTSAPSAISITAQEVGADVVFAGSGTLNLAALTLAGTHGLALSGFDDDIFPPILRMASSGAISTYTGSSLVPPSGFSDFPANRLASYDSGQIFGGEYWFGAPAIQVPDGYVSGQFLSASMTYTNQSLASLQLNPGTYDWRWGSGANSDFMRLIIVPEPSSAALLGLGFAGLLACARRSTRD
jgi:hypothetical protein